MKKLLPSNSCTVAVVGLGYVGMPLALLISRHTDHSVIGFDVDEERITALESLVDTTGETSKEELSTFFRKSGVSNKKEDLLKASVFIIAVPTPIDEYNNPDLTYIREATEMVQGVLVHKKRCLGYEEKAVVIYESTVYPGVTDDICVPILVEGGFVELSKDFEVGYSPERVSPGKGSKKLTDIVKIVSGNNEEMREWMSRFYSSFISAGVFIASSIKVAEAAKILENIQRDVNIALMNEASVLFKRLDVDIHDVIDAASSKWNFVDFRPGIVGGHCIGVDPYYLIHIAKKHRYSLRLMSSARDVNESMPGWLARSIVKEFNRRGVGKVGDSRVLLLGATFKEDCPDLRNSKSLLIAKLLKEYGFEVDVVDCVNGGGYHVDESGYEHTICQTPRGRYQLIIFAVKHAEYRKEFVGILEDHKSDGGCLVVDLKDAIPKAYSDLRL